MKKLLSVLSIFVLSLVVLVGCSPKKSADNEIKIGVSPDPHSKLVSLVLDDLEKEGIKITLVEFTDYVKPNLALNDGELDANFFQHEPYFNDFKAKENLDLVSLGKVHVEPMALYSTNFKSLEDLPAGAEIAVPNDTVNGARALLLLEANGLIKLKAGAGIEATENDIVENPKNLKITSGMSITDSQNINHQLRYFDLHRALRLINFISYKVYQELQSNKIKEITFKFNISQVSEPELFFIDRLKHYSQNNIDIKVVPEVNKIADEVNFEDMPFYLSVGDLWTSLKIGNDILNSKGNNLDSQFILNFAITQNNLGNTMAGEALLSQILSKEVNNSTENEIKITSYYILSMLYLRHHNRKFHNIEKAENYLEHAFNLLNDPSFIHNDKEFKRIFNRNGYALLLFKKNQIEEAIKLLENKIRELDVLISGGKEYAILHKTVLLYNISQCYNVLGDFRKSINLLQEIIEIDTYDADYHYEIVKILFDNDLLDEGLEWLEIIEKKNIVDLSIQSAMKGYYFLQKEDYHNAALHYETAYNLEYNDRYTGEILYSYLYTLFNLEQYETILNIDISGINLNDDYKADIEYLINETNEMRFKNNCEGLKI